MKEHFAPVDMENLACLLGFGISQLNWLHSWISSLQRGKLNAELANGRLAMCLGERWVPRAVRLV